MLNKALLINERFWFEIIVVYHDDYVHETFLNTYKKFYRNIRIYTIQKAPLYNESFLLNFFYNFSFREGEQVWRRCTPKLEVVLFLRFVY